MTNHQVVSKLNVQQMAVFIESAISGDIDMARTFCSMCPDESCDHEKCVLWWLESDAESPQGLHYFPDDQKTYAVYRDENENTGKSRWRAFGNYTWQCTGCKHKYTGEGINLYRYCPDCGARMDGAKDINVPDKTEEDDGPAD